MNEHPVSIVSETSQKEKHNHENCTITIMILKNDKKMYSIGLEIHRPRKQYDEKKTKRKFVKY